MSRGTNAPMHPLVTVPAYKRSFKKIARTYEILWIHHEILRYTSTVSRNCPEYFIKKIWEISQKYTKTGNFAKPSHIQSEIVTCIFLSTVSAEQDFLLNNLNCFIKISKFSTKRYFPIFILQGAQLNMSVFFWYPAKSVASEMSSVWWKVRCDVCVELWLA